MALKLILKREFLAKIEMPLSMREKREMSKRISQRPKLFKDNHQRVSTTCKRQNQWLLESQIRHKIFTLIKESSSNLVMSLRQKMTSWEAHHIIINLFRSNRKENWFQAMLLAPSNTKRAMKFQSSKAKFKANTGKIQIQSDLRRQKVKFSQISKRVICRKFP